MSASSSSFSSNSNVSFSYLDKGDHVEVSHGNNVVGKVDKVGMLSLNATYVQGNTGAIRVRSDQLLAVCDSHQHILDLATFRPKIVDQQQIIKRPFFDEKSLRLFQKLETVQDKDKMIDDKLLSLYGINVSILEGENVTEDQLELFSHFLPFAMQQLQGIPEKEQEEILQRFRGLTHRVDAQRKKQGRDAAVALVDKARVDLKIFSSKKASPDQVLGSVDALFSLIKRVEGQQFQHLELKDAIVSNLKKILSRALSEAAESFEKSDPDLAKSFLHQKLVLLGIDLEKLSINADKPVDLKTLVKYEDILDNEKNISKGLFPVLDYMQKKIDAHRQKHVDAAVVKMLGERNIDTKVFIQSQSTCEQRIDAQEKLQDMLADITEGRGPSLDSKTYKLLLDTVQGIYDRGVRDSERILKVAAIEPIGQGQHVVQGAVGKVDHTWDVKMHSPIDVTKDEQLIALEKKVEALKRQQPQDEAAIKAANKQLERVKGDLKAYNEFTAIDSQHPEKFIVDVTYCNPEKGIFFISDGSGHASRKNSTQMEPIRQFGETLDFSLCKTPKEVEEKMQIELTKLSKNIWMAAAFTLGVVVHTKFGKILVTAQCGDTNLLLVRENKSRKILKTDHKVEFGNDRADGFTFSCTPLRSKDILVFTSDGVFDYATDEQIGEVAKRSGSLESKPDDIKKLVMSVDNTAIAAEYKKKDPVRNRDFKGQVNPMKSDQCDDIGVVVVKI